MPLSSTPGYSTPPDLGAVFQHKIVKLMVILCGVSLVTNLVFSCAGGEVIRDTVFLTESGPVESQPFALTRSSFLPGYRINVRARLPENHEMTYEVTLLQADRQDAFSYQQNVWTERGIWREGWESGIWRESDLEESFTFVPHQTGRFLLSFELEELERAPTWTTADPIAPVQITYSVVSGAVSPGLLWGSFFCLLIGLVLTAMVVVGDQQRRQWIRG